MMNDVKFKIGDVITCVDNTYLENSLEVGCDYVVDLILDEEHVSVKGFFGTIHSDRFMKKGDTDV